MSSLPTYQVQGLRTAVHHDIGGVRSAQTHVHRTSGVPERGPFQPATSPFRLIGRTYTLAMHHCDAINTAAPQSGLGLRKRVQRVPNARSPYDSSQDARLFDRGNYRPGRAPVV
eukprot:4113155-Pleurochrysis_carterae.AAC.1